MRDVPTNRKVLAANILLLYRQATRCLKHLPLNFAIIQFQILKPERFLSFH